MPDNRRYESELRRVLDGPRTDDSIPGIGIVRFVVRCDGNSGSVIVLAKAAMKAVVRQCISGWTEDADWQSYLPLRFVNACAKEMSEDEVEKWLSKWQTMSDLERKSEEQACSWSLKNWLYGMAPSTRVWQWWDAHVIDNDTIAVAVAVDSWPFAWGTLSWLFRASGATVVEEDS